MRRALTYEDSVRWGRCLAEAVKIAYTVCPASATEAYGEIVNRLHVRSHTASAEYSVDKYNAFQSDLCLGLVFSRQVKDRNLAAKH